MLTSQFVRDCNFNMIGAMKRKASLSLSETMSSSQTSPLSSQENYHNHNNHVVNNNHNNHNNHQNHISSGHPKPEKRIRWDGPRTQSLIDHYRTHEYLWNPKLADYKNDKKRTQCLENWLEQNHLEKELVNEVKMKLHGLRTSFGHQLKLESSTTEQEKEESGVFVSKWQWYNQLSFLKETMVFRSTSSNNANHSPVDSPPNLEHGHHMSHQNPMGHHEMDDSDNVKMEISSNTPLNMQVLPHYAVQQPHDIQEYIMQSHHHSQPHNLTVSAISLPVHEGHPSIIQHARKEEEDPLSYHQPRITATPPMAHMQNLPSHQQPAVAHAASHPQSELSRYQQSQSGTSACCACNCANERQRFSSLGEKLGRLVEETFNNLHPEYQEMARIEIQQVLGKYLQKPVP